MSDQTISLSRADRRKFEKAMRRAQRLGLIETPIPQFLARDRIPVTRDPHTLDLFAPEDQPQ